MTAGHTRSLSVYVVVACLVLMLPIVILLILAFGHGGYLKFPPDSYSLRWFGDQQAGPQRALPARALRRGGAVVAHAAHAATLARRGPNRRCATS